MNRNLMIVALTTLLGAGQVFGQNCTNQNNRVTGNALTTTISGNTICVNNGGPMQQWQEFHRPGGTLVEWHKGGNTIEDPAGSWSIQSNQITYTFGAASYTYELRGGPGGGAGSGYSLCGVNGTSFQAVATILAGQVGCGY